MLTNVENRDDAEHGFLEHEPVFLATLFAHDEDLDLLLIVARGLLWQSSPLHKL